METPKVDGHVRTAAVAAVLCVACMEIVPGRVLRKLTVGGRDAPTKEGLQYSSSQRLHTTVQPQMEAWGMDLSTIAENLLALHIQEFVGDRSWKVGPQACDHSIEQQRPT
jgi:hypothetical protein